MRIANDSIIRPPATTVALPFTSLAIYLGSISDYAIQITYLTTNASVKLQCSTDPGKPLDQSWTVEDITHWTDIEDSAVLLTENGDLLYDVVDASYRWVRLVITGSGTLTSARFQLKGG